MTKIALIAAAAGSRQVIGDNAKIPWHFKTDFQHFKNVTMGHPVLMGRVTYQSILASLGKPLPGRRNMVITRDKNFHDPRIDIFYDVKTALDAAASAQKIFVIGGQQIYEQTLPLADEIYLTHIDHPYEGDAFFPQLPTAEWHMEELSRTTEKEIPLRFCLYRRPGGHQDH
jgi:dihydrofolate reductase